MALSNHAKEVIIAGLADQPAADELSTAVDGATSVSAGALPSTSFTDAAVTSKLITGYVSGAGTVAASDTLLQAINKLNGNTAAKADYSEPAVSLTLDHAVGATACICRKIGKSITLEIPGVAIADGLGTVLSSGAGDIPVGSRPAEDLYFVVRVNDNAGTYKAGLLKISSAGTVTVGADVSNTGFTNAAAAATFSTSIAYTVA